MAALSIREEEEARADSCCTLADSCFIMLLLLLEDSCFCDTMLLVIDSCFCESTLPDSCWWLIWPMPAKDTDSRDCEDDLRWGQNMRKPFRRKMLTST